MIKVQNVRPTYLLEDKNPYEVHFNKAPEISHLQVLGSTVYVFIYEEEQNLKSEKFEARALKGTLVGYDGHTIYRVFIRSQDKVIRVKHLWIFEDTSKKDSASLPDFEGKPTFEGFLATDREVIFSDSDNDGKRTTKKRPRTPAGSQTGGALKPTPKV